MVHFIRQLLFTVLIIPAAMAWPPDEDGLKTFRSLLANNDYDGLKEFLDRLSIESQAWVNCVLTRAGYTSLHLAADEGNGSILVLLLNHGAYPDAQSVYGESALDIGIRHKNLTIIVVLLMTGVEVGQNQILQAGDNQGIVELLTHHRRNYQEQNRAGQGFYSCIRAPIEDPYGESDLHRYVRCGDTTAISRCISSSPQQLTARRGDGCNPLHISVLYGQLRAAALLLMTAACIKYTVNPFAMKDMNNITPSMMAEACGQQAMALYINGVSSGNHPLNIAVSQNDFGLITLLLEHNADPNFTSEMTASPLTIALLNRQPDIVAILLLHGASLMTVHRQTLDGIVQDYLPNSSDAMLFQQRNRDFRAFLISLIFLMVQSQWGRSEKD